MNNCTLPRPHSQASSQRNSRTRLTAPSAYHQPRRLQLFADGVIAGYIHDISARHRRADAVNRHARARLGSALSRRKRLDLLRAPIDTRNGGEGRLFLPRHVEEALLIDRGIGPGVRAVVPREGDEILQGLENRAR
jgi:hypothetical protein